MRFSLAIALAGGCRATDDLTSVQTDGGTWTVTLEDPPSGPGPTELQLAVAPVGGVVHDVVASMPDMGHTADGAVDDQGDGAFAVTLDFSMSGWWVVDGAVASDDADEGFRLEFEVP